MIFRRLAPLLTSLLVIMLATMTRGTTMSSAYTNWPTDNAPPNTIVLAMIPVDPVSGGPLSGCVRMDGYPSNLILNFNDDYLAHVLPNEWPNPSPQQGYQAGAAAARNYGWYWTLSYVAPKPCGSTFGADVDNSTNFQVYNPTKPRLYPTDDAVWETSGQRLYNPNSGYWTPNSIFESGYVAGSTNDMCGRVPPPYDPGLTMSQNGSNACANNGHQWTQITTGDYYFNKPSYWDGPSQNNRVPNWSFESGGGHNWSIWNGNWAVCSTCGAPHGRSRMTIYAPGPGSVALFEDMVPTHNASGRAYTQSVWLYCEGASCAGTMCMQYNVQFGDVENDCTNYSIGHGYWTTLSLPTSPVYSQHPVQMNVRFTLFLNTVGVNLDVDWARFDCASLCP